MCGPETSLNNYESDFMQPEHSVTNTHKEAMGMTHGQCACPEKKNQQDARAATIAYQVLPGSHASSMREERMSYGSRTGFIVSSSVHKEA